MPLQDFETFKREHIDTPAVGDIWRYVETTGTQEHYRVIVSNSELVQLKSLLDGHIEEYNVRDFTRLNSNYNTFQFETRSIPSNYSEAELEKKFIQIRRLNNSPPEIRLVETADRIIHTVQNGQRDIYINTMMYWDHF